MRNSPNIYLDNNATTSLDPGVLEAMAPYLGGFIGNASSRHSHGRAARRAIADAQARIAEAIGCQSQDVVFTSGATESNNLAITGLSIPAGSSVLLNPTEHPSAIAPTIALVERGCKVTYMPVDQSGRLGNVESTGLDSAALVVAQLANSETGTLQDLVALERRLPPGCHLHVDVTQAIGRIPVNFGEFRSATFSFSGHKIHGPCGIGALLVRADRPMAPSILGGMQQAGLRSGTEPVALIVGLGRAVERAVGEMPQAAMRMARLRDRLESQLLDSIPGVLVNGCVEHRLPNTTNLSFLGVDAEPLLIALDLEGVSASSGTACASGALEPSPVLKAMGFNGDRLRSAVRFSVGRFTTEEEIDRAVSIIHLAAQRVRSRVHRS